MASRQRFSPQQLPTGKPSLKNFGSTGRQILLIPGRHSGHWEGRRKCLAACVMECGTCEAQHSKGELFFHPCHNVISWVHAFPGYPRSKDREGLHSLQRSQSCTLGTGINQRKSRISHYFLQILQDTDPVLFSATASSFDRWEDGRKECLSGTAYAPHVEKNQT